MNNLLEHTRNNSWIELAARWILGLTFIYASIHKIAAPAEFAKIIYGYDLFPAVFINLIAIIIPFLEMVTGLALVIGIYPRSAAINLIRGHEFDCGCFAVGQSGYSSSSEATLIRDIIYFVLGLQIIFYSGVRRICSISMPKS